MYATLYTMKKAISYIRFSSPAQAEGDSYGRQLRDTLAYCKANNLELLSDADYMFFDKGVSAFSGKLQNDTTELSRFLSLIRDGSVPIGSTLIIESLDRLSREHVRAALPRFMDILNAGIDIHTLLSNKTYYHDRYDEFDLFQSIMEMSRSHRESKYKAERIASRWEQKQEEARNGVPLGGTKPAWLDLVYANGKTEKPANDPKAKPVGFMENDKVAIVKRIFQLTIDGYGRNVVAQMLNAEGIPAFKTKNGWGASTINQILTNNAVLGIYQPYTKGEDGKRVPRGESNPKFYPSIIDREMFDQARAATTGRNITKARRHPPEFQIWQGIALCALCGSPLHSYSNGRKPKETGKPAPRWMRCYNARKGKCEAGSISVASCEPVFAHILAKLNILALVQSSANAVNTKLEVVTGKLVAERAKLADFKATYAAKRSSTILDLIYETEAYIEALAEQERTYLATLAADQIVDTTDFFAKLDLRSTPGRSRANSILKRLKVSVLINPTQYRFSVVKDDQRAFDVTQRGQTDMVFHPADSTYSAVIQKQEGSFTPMVGTNDDGDMGDDKYENEGYSTNDGY
jgi:DNA invertase Pin-like site-specific DNA recombinase